MGSKGGSTTTGSFSPPPEFTKAYKEALGMARGATSKPYEQYSGNLVAGLTPSQTQGISNINAAQGMALPAIQQGMQYTNQAAQGITPELYDRFYSPYVKDVANTTFGNLMESQAQQQSNLKGGAIQAGAFGGDRGGIAQAEMARQQQLGNAMAMSNIYNQGYGQAMGLAGQQVANLGSMGQQIAGLGAGAQASVLQGAQAQMAAGVQQQATEQARLQAAYDQWTQRQAYPYQQAQFFANVAQGLGAGAGGTSSTTQPAPNMFSQIMGGVGAIGSIYGASDKRVKENIEPVGTLNDGQTIYRYNFKGSPKTEIGLLAQEVEGRKPGSVAQVNGLKMVDYKGATEDAAEMSSAGGFVAPSEYRQGLAGGGGVPFYPYADARTYVPEGKFDVRGSNMPKQPDPFEDKGLAEDWKNISPLSKEQASGLRALAGDVGIDLPEKGDISKIFKSGVAVGPTEAETAWIYRTNPDEGLLHTRLASGGVAARHGYADGGYEPGRMDQAIDEAAGLGAVPDPEVDPRLTRMESGGDFGAKNAQGYVGRMQFGPDRLTDAKRAGIIPADMSSEDFRNNEEAQKATETWHFGDINNFIDKSGLAAVVGKSIKGIPVTRQGLVNVAHLGGQPGLRHFVASNGRYDPADANGTHLSDYLAMARNEGGVGGATPVPASAEGLSAVAEPAAAEGLGGAEEPKTGLNFDMKKLFASDENPSLIEKVMGRRLSPEARSAVLNASFALMAGRSPFFATNLGEAGKVGTQTYYNALKQGADITRQGYEAQTGRMQAGGQLAGIVGPIYKAITMWQSDPSNAGKPLPDWIKYQLDYLRQLGFSAPSSIGGVSPDGGVGITTPSPSETVQPVIGGTTKTETNAPSTTMPPANGSEEVTSGAQTPVSPEPTPRVQNSQQSENFFDQVLGADNPSNPFYNLRMAKNLYNKGLYEEAARFRDEGNKLLTEISKTKTITTANGEIINVPSALTAASEVARTNAAAEAYQKSVNQIYDEDYRTPLRTYSQTYQTLANAANVLREYETGSLANFKSQIAGVMNSLGFPVTQDQLDAATDNQKFTKLIIGNLLNSGLKQNLGNVALGELEIAMKGTASAENQPAANRSIIGVSMGLLNWQKDRAMAIGQYIKQNGGTSRVDPIDLQDFVSSWDEKIPQYTETSIANTPVKGELNFSDPASRAKAKPGYKYVIPKGNYPFGNFAVDTVATYNGEGFEVEE